MQTKTVADLISCAPYNVYEWEKKFASIYKELIVLMGDLEKGAQWPIYIQDRFSEMMVLYRNVQILHDMIIELAPHEKLLTLLIDKSLTRMGKKAGEIYHGKDSGISLKRVQ